MQPDESIAGHVWRMSLSAAANALLARACGLEDVSEPTSWISLLHKLSVRGGITTQLDCASQAGSAIRVGCFPHKRACIRMLFLWIALVYIVEPHPCPQAVVLIAVDSNICGVWC